MRYGVFRVKLLRNIGKIYCKTARKYKFSKVVQVE